MPALLEAVALQPLDHLAALVEGAHEGDHDTQVVHAHLVAHLAHGLALESERVCERRLHVAAGTAEADHRVLFVRLAVLAADGVGVLVSSEEHTSELQTLLRISYAVFCLTTKN